MADVKSPPALEAAKPAAAPVKPFTAIPASRRAISRTLVTIAGFLGPLSGTIYLPALPTLANVFRVDVAAINGTVSAFMVIFAFGPLVWAYFVDRGGRRPLYLISLLIYIVANVILAAAPPRLPVLYIFRVIQAFGASCVISMGAGTIADITAPAKRAFAMSIFLLGPQLGPVIGPVIGGAFAGTENWRWIFGLPAILAFVIWVTMWLFLPETLRYRVGQGTEQSNSRLIVWPPWPVTKMVEEEKRGPKPPKLTLKALWNLCIYPPIFIVSFNSSILFAGFYGIATIQPEVLEQRYHWTAVEVGLAYLAPGLAMIVGSLTSGRISDWHRARLVARTGDAKVAPETRLQLQIWGVLVAASGTLIYGWVAQYQVHPAVLLVATALAGAGMSWVFVTTTSFCTEIKPTQPAAVVALGNMLRNPAAAVASAIINPLAKAMGLGWCFTGLALLEFIVVGGSVLLLYAKGSTWWQRAGATSS